MSRLYEALQKSQVEAPSASPLATPAQPDGQAPGAQVPGLPIDNTAALDALATQAPPMAAWLSVPADRILRPIPTPEQRLISITTPNSPGAEMFRVLSTKLAHMRRKRPLKKLLITSAVGDEGKSVVSVNLAFTLARRAGERVLLIEADLRRPTASALLSSSRLRGISEWHEHKLALQDAFYQLEGMPLWLLSAGEGIEEPLPLLESDAFAQMLTAVSEGFDWVLLDCTPMLPMADATSLSRLCDGVLVVAREGHTHKRALIRALASIDKSKQLGFVFNEASTVQVGYERYYGGYGYYGQKKSKGDEQAENDHMASA
ncbi:MAG TPA: CpsD/CapB family tyrosine-protein kinase [Candidatus Bathyarchaeia archaeon]|nr:CpsD/CapB family tyrosine-protein kinase [Candidatus Bathyarchaeia archaeon]